MNPAFLQAAERKLDASVPEPVRRIAQTLQSAGFRCWLVGGGVRDVLLGQLRGSGPRGGDWDLASDARPEQVKPLFKKVLPTGIEHGTVTVVLDRQHYELTTLRGERGFSDGRRPDEVYFVDDITADLARRDFTVNAIAFDLGTSRLVDPFDGCGDLERNLLRAVGTASDRFAEDGLRVLRAARFCSTLDIELEEETRRAIRPSLGSFRKVSQERVRDEWWKALKSARPSACFEVQRDEGLLEITAPKLAPSESTWRLLDAAPADPVLRLAVLCASALDGAPRGRARVAVGLFSQLRASNHEQKRVELLVSEADPDITVRDGALRRWLGALGRASAADVLSALPFLPGHVLERADFIRLARAELDGGRPLVLSELALTGNDLVTAGVLAPGPRLGQVLKALLAEVLERPAANEKATLLALAKDLSTSM